MREYLLPVFGGALAALAVVGIAVFVRASAGPGTLTAQTGEATAEAAATPGGTGDAPVLGGGAGLGLAPAGEGGEGGGAPPPPDPGGPPRPADEGYTPPPPSPTHEASITVATATAVATPAPESACLSGTAVASPGTNPGLVADCSALLRAKETLRGTGSLNWQGDRAIAEWDGVTTGGDPPRVTGIELPNKGLTGSVPPELGELSELTTLRLDANRLTGSFPAELGRLSKLTVLSTRGGNRFRGNPYPASLGGLTAMRSLNLTGGHTGGPIPDLSRMTELEYLSLANNRFTGPLPAWLGGLTNLRMLTLHGNLLSGKLPPELGHLTRLEDLQIAGAGTFSGCLPRALKNAAPGLNDAASLGLPDCPAPPAAAPACETEAVVPGHASKPALVADCSALLAAKEALEGPATLDWGATKPLADWEGVSVGGSPPRVYRLDLRARGLGGGIPAALGRLTGLQFLQLQHNHLSGPVPAALGGLDALLFADLGRNRLSGALPAALADPPRLERIDFFHNDGLSGCVPAALRGKAQNLPLHLSWCDTGGAAHPPAAATPPGAAPADDGDGFALRVDQGEGSLLPIACPAPPADPSASTPCRALQASTLEACSNGVAVAEPDGHPGLVRDCALLLESKAALNGTAAVLNWSANLAIASWDGVTTAAAGEGGAARVTSLHLRNKGLAGVIPPQLGYLAELRHLHLGANNTLTGEIPPELGYLSKLIRFYAGGGNRLEGRIPPGLGNLTELGTLYLSNNRLTGPIPDLSRTRLRHLELRGNSLSGPLPGWLADQPELRILLLNNNDFSGEIPRGLGRLPLYDVMLAYNDLTGCVPSSLEDVRGRNDIAYLNLPWCLRYNALDSTGAVAAAGSWAILGAGGPAGSGGAGGASGSADATPAPPAVLTTWEDLRSDAATLRIHQTDSGGTSWATEFGAVGVGDLIEWRKADDCWVRYRVTGAPTRPASGSSRWEFPVEWMTYAGTGTGCTGAVGAATVLRVDEEPVPVTSHAMAAPSLVADTPVRHGPWLLHPLDWSDRSAFEEQVYHAPTMAALGGAQSDPDAWLPYPETASTDNLAEARRFQFWRDPVLPSGAKFDWAESGLPTSPTYGYCAWYSTSSVAVEVCVYFLLERPHYTTVYYQGNDHGIVKEARVIDGRPAIVEYSPPGPKYEYYFNPKAYVFDPTTGLMYFASGRSAGFDIDAVVDIVRSLYRTSAP